MEKPFKDYTKEDWVLYFIEAYGQYDGAHHKQWVMDQCARILKGTKVIVEITLGEPSQEYLDWVKEMKAGKNGPDTYDYDTGTAP